ncbi:MAG: HDIG domain-containing protein [Candidatus Bathyarchaeota archaeon]|nr:HDIG domain-containing protein [Candidatus Bathyarchaeota archaeon]
MLNAKLKDIAETIQNPELKDKVTTFLENPTFCLEGKVYSGPSFDRSPGGLKHHHTYVGGYVDHVVATWKIACALCDVVEQVYGGKVDRDLAAAGVLLHDIFKPVTYTVDGEGNFASSPLADKLDHISLATAELVRRDFPAELIHIVASHYGSYGSIKPRTVEALVVHLADNVDSQLNGQVLDAAWYLTRKATGEGLAKLNASEAFEIVRSKATEGWKGVEEAVERINQQRVVQKT